MRAGILFISIAFMAAGCSVSKQIGRQAQKIVTHDSALVNAHMGISIMEASSGKMIYNYQADKYFVPASNTKLATCYAALKFLGDSLPGLQYSYGDGAVIIKGTGDPSFLSPEFKNQPVLDFLSANRNKMEWDTSNWKDEMLGSGWSWTDYMETYMAPRSAIAINENSYRVSRDGSGKIKFSPSYFRRYYNGPDSPFFKGITISRKLNSNEIIILSGRRNSEEISFHADPETIAGILRDTLKKEVSLRGKYAGSFKTIYSQPTDSLLKPMMHRSDNFFAEQSLMMVSNKLLGYMNDAAIIDSLLKTEYKDLPQKPRWVDGSGLSRYNLFTPYDLVAILNKMKNQFGMERLKVILATGNEGTLDGRYKNLSGYIYAKTGTLSGVVALSGFLYTKKGRLLIFSFLVNNHIGSATPVRDAMERFVTQLKDKY
jgi:serine-type D-Ala-D-Ala carboxypeptidase/endopeptidase (penicillin-binding protein 4)